MDGVGEAMYKRYLIFLFLGAKVVPASIAFALQS